MTEKHEKEPFPFSMMMADVIAAESGIRGRDPGPWRVVAEYLARLERRVVELERLAAQPKGE